jgi:hypothetical protein
MSADSENRVEVGGSSTSLEIWFRDGGVKVRQPTVVVLVVFALCVAAAVAVLAISRASPQVAAAIATPASLRVVRDGIRNRSTGLGRKEQRTVTRE